MNSPWNNNLELLKNRFPELFTLLKPEIEKVEKSVSQSAPAATAENPADSAPVDTTENNAKGKKNPFSFWQIENARNGSLTVRENSILLHSAYNPDREAQQASVAFDSQNFEAAVFSGFGLGYLPSAFCKNHKNKTIILVENDIHHFLAALYYFDWQPVFQHEKCILAICCSHQELLGIINHFGIKNCVFFSQKNQTAHSASYFEGFQTLIERNKTKEEINTNTLERFASLWLKNNCRNLEKSNLSDGISIYKNKARDLDAVVLAAGPSLTKVLPYLSEIKQRSILICVDTALRSCLKAKVEPDFVILIDPQYWAARHLAGIKSESSVLITEGAAYPSVFNFKCRKTVVCSSLFPLGQYFERKLASFGEKGRIETGGSVSTSAWDFARFIGAKRIFFAGLDLSYPEKNTHIKGSTFEEAAHKVSSRLKTVHTQSCSSLFSIKTEEGIDYTGKKVLTDTRMKMFAWWFESHIAAKTAGEKSPEQTFTFCPENLAIPGIKVFSIDDFLKTESKQTERKNFFNESEKNCYDNFEESKKIKLKEDFLKIKQNLCETLQALYENAAKGFSICDKVLSGKETNLQLMFQKLHKIDSEISNSSVKEIVSLVFPTENQLNRIFQNEAFPHDEIKANIFRSKIIYRELKKAVKDYLKNLSV